MSFGGCEQVRETGRRDKKTFPFFKMTGKNSRAVSVGSGARLNQTQNWSSNYFKVRKHCFVRTLQTQYANFIGLIYAKISAFLSLKILGDTDRCQEWNITTPLLKIS